jgi:hypothetical protein
MIYSLAVIALLALMILKILRFLIASIVLVKIVLEKLLKIRTPNVLYAKKEILFKSANSIRKKL